MRPSFASFAALAAVLAIAPNIAAQDDGFGPPSPPVVPGPRLVLPETEYDWGQVLQGDLIEHIYKVRNAGDDVLRISQVKPGCGCTLADWTREISPGEEGQVVLRIDTGKQHAPTFRRDATIYSNDRNQPQSKIWIGGQIRFIVTMQPPQVRIAGLVGTEIAGEVTLTPGTELGIEVSGGTAQGGKCSVKAIDLAPDGKSYIVRIGAGPTEIAGMARENVEVDIRTSDGATRKHTIPVIIDHQDRIQLNPPGNLVFQRNETERLKSPGSAPVMKPVQIFTSSPEVRFQILEVEVLDAPEGLFSTELRTVKEGERYVLNVTVNAYRSEESVRGRIRLVTDDARLPEKEIRLFAQFGAPTPPQPGAGAGGAAALTPPPPARKADPQEAPNPGGEKGQKLEPALKPNGS